MTVHGRTHRVLWAQDGLRTWLWSAAGTFAVDELPAHRSHGGSREVGSAEVPSPMPGAVIAVHVGVGDPVRSGDPLIVVEAMKMEHALTAPHDGTVSQVQVRVGDQVRVGQCLAVVTAEPAS
jgi:acetyl-CoA/propionyl-CoA carboxylase biotin carboxyl carrier protein